MLHKDQRVKLLKLDGEDIQVGLYIGALGTVLEDGHTAWTLWDQPPYLKVDDQKFPITVDQVEVL